MSAPAPAPRPWCGVVRVREGEDAAGKVGAAAQRVSRLYVYADGLWPCGELTALQRALATLYHAAHAAAPQVDTRVPLCPAAQLRPPPEAAAWLGYAAERQDAADAALPLHELPAAAPPSKGWCAAGGGGQLPQHAAACMGGTFDRFHLGHKLLLAAAAASVRDGGYLFCGCSGDALLRDKKLGELLEDYGLRAAVVGGYLRAIRPEVRYEVGELKDGYGPSITDPAFDAIVVSEETAAGGAKCNEKRAEKGMPPMAVVSVGLVSAADGALTEGLAHDAKLSSSGLRRAQVGQLLDCGRDWARRTPPGPYAIGVTGTFAAGKSTATRILSELGCEVIDCDKLGHAAYLKGTRCYDAVVARFGEGLLGPDGEIDRRKLGPLVFGDEPEKKAAMKSLTDIVWPEIRSMAQERIRAAQTPVVAVEAAILLEAGWDTIVDEVWLVSVPPSVSRERLMKRNSIDEEAADRRLASQPTGRARIHSGRCHVLIPNHDDEAALRQVVTSALDGAKRRAAVSLSDAEGALPRRWAALAARHGASPEAAADWWRRIRDRYCETRRRYHTLTHLDELFGCVDEVAAAGELAEPDLVAFAIFFHDVVYDPQATHPANEMQSAELWRQCAAEALPKLPETARETVAGWIERTAYHMKGPADGDLAHFLDADLAVLGRPPAEYARYAEQIRMEYAHVPDAAFRTGRPKAMQQFVDCGPEGPYFTARVRAAVGAQAVANVKAEIARLTAA
eukprot:TRINITY_DN17275_c0_g1_i1.p1 TRINITY_DN17275_c0_g1~~TRINITY_DN17275_c0_g1_i1.p1  ORF type:complete len:772 (+),score=250.67 TRINITY_DN17275_c0_g1_i1:113-2317(+)